MEAELNKARRRYERICEKLEQLNEEAFSLEKEIMYLQSKIESDKK